MNKYQSNLPKINSITIPHKRSEDVKLNIHDISCDNRQFGHLLWWVNGGNFAHSVWSVCKDSLH